jgi:hypothetical protein
MIMALPWILCLNNPVSVFSYTAFALLGKQKYVKTATNSPSQIHMLNLVVVAIVVVVLVVWRASAGF